MLVCVDNSTEKAKLFGNKSAAFYQLALLAESEGATSKDTSELLQHALDDGLKSVELDSSYEKGHFRLVSRAMLRNVHLVRFIIYISTSKYQIPRTHIKFGERSFSYAGPSACNSLPHHVREITDTTRFKRQLKTVLFQRATTSTFRLFIRSRFILTSMFLLVC